MKYLLLIGVLLFSCAVVNAHPQEPLNVNLSVGYDYYITPNEGNNYDDGQGISARLHHSIYKNISGAVEFAHLTDIHFPSVDDPKGSFGELRGYGAAYNLFLNLPYNEDLLFYLTGGAGYYWWDFKENPFLQDNNVKVDVDPSLGLKAGLGANYKLNDSWSVTFEGGWFDTDIDKDARDNNGLEWNILDDDAIGLQYIYLKAEAKIKF